jgi:hypothetical protein
MVKETTTISRKMEILQGLGFKLQSSSDAPFSVYTIHYLPGIPATLGDTGAEGSEFEGYRPQDAISGLRTRPVEVEGEKYFYWHLDSGDPIGEYRIEVYVDDRLTETLIFTVTE